ncbi:MAG: inositol phosphorylceramide synthase [Polyangiaceae bacterium]|nr:inositol phosphorylceramide synthase [Polyangiaceae bacterium]
MRSLWPRYTLLPPLPFAAYFLVVAGLGRVRVDHVIMVLLVPALAYGNAATKKLCVGTYPMALVGLLYDAMGPLKNLGLTPENVHNCDLRAVELALFGVGSGAERMTLQDWFLEHHSPVLDVYFAIPYGLYIFAALGFGVYLYFRDFRRLQLFAWGFFVVNVVGYVTYHLYPAAPPWYYHAHGCVVDLTVSASEGPALARVDALTGLGYFAGLYGRSNAVFGAMPSLHAAYPTLILLAGWRVLRWPGRSLGIVFLLSMAIGAVYLDHHWVIDVLVGLGYALAAFGVVALAARRLGRVPVPGRVEPAPEASTP